MITIKFELRADRPDAAGRCQIHLRAYFDGHRLRQSTGELCTASQWDSDAGKFRRSLPGYQDANDSLKSQAARIEAAYRHVRISGQEPTPDALRAALADLAAVSAPKVAAAPKASPALLQLFDEYVGTLRARGLRDTSVKTYSTTRNRLASFEGAARRSLTVANYDARTHDALLGHLRLKMSLTQNSVWVTVRQVLSFLRWVAKTGRGPLALSLDGLAEKREDGDKGHLSTAEIAMLERAMLPSRLVATRDAFLFCCYTGLRYSDLRDLRPAHLHDWDGGQVLRLTQTKTRAGVSIYLSPPAALLLAKYRGTRIRLLPVTANQVMNRNLKKISRLAGLTAATEVVEVTGGQLVKREAPKWETVTMHTARHTFAVHSLLRGLPLAVLQKVLGHRRIMTTMIYAKVVEDFQHHEMRRVWEGVAARSLPAADGVCAIDLAA